jgi:cell division control protein 6
MGLLIPFTGLSVGEVFDRLRAGLDVARVIFIVVLDEADALVKSRGDRLLYELTRINETLNKSKVTIICISNDLRFKEVLDPRVVSSLSEEEIVFRPYDASELLNILSERAKTAFFGSALSDAALSLCAALAAAEHGDARRALDLLRVAGEVAERKGVRLVVEDHVRDAEKHIENNRIFEGLQNLTLHSKLVVLSLYQLSKPNGGGTTTGDISEIYDELCAELGVAPLTQRRLSTLVNELDAMGLVNAKVVSMGRYGRTKKMRLEIPRGTIREVFGGDNRLARLVDLSPKCILKGATSVCDRTERLVPKR